MGYLTANQVQQRLNISATTYFRWLREGRLVPDKTEGSRTRLFLEEQIAAMPDYRMDNSGNKTVSVAMWEPGRTYYRKSMRIRNIRRIPNPEGQDDYYEVTYANGAIEELYKNARITQA